MNDPIYFAPLRVPFVDPDTGIITRPWQLLLQGLFNRTGGANGQSNDDLLQGMPIELGAAELLALQTTASDAAGQAPVSIPSTTFDDLVGELRETRELLAELTKSLQGLQQGTISL